VARSACLTYFEYMAEHLCRQTAPLPIATAPVVPSPLIPTAREPSPATVCEPGVHAHDAWVKLGSTSRRKQDIRIWECTMHHKKHTKKDEKESRVNPLTRGEGPGRRGSMGGSVGTLHLSERATPPRTIPRTGGCSQSCVCEECCTVV
jgi:hypothetical protein